MKQSENSLSVVTISLESTYDRPQGENLNEYRTELISNVIHELGENDIFLLPAGFYKHEDVTETTVKNDAEIIKGILEANGSRASVCFGIDSTPKEGTPYEYQLAVAVDWSGIVGVGRKSNPASKEEKSAVCLAFNYDDTEFGYERIFKKGDKRFYIAVCFDIYGLTKLKRVNPGVDAILVPIHGFERHNRTSYFALNGFAGASKAWSCPVFGAAVFFDNLKINSWPTGVKWALGNKSVKEKGVTYDEIRIQMDGEYRIDGTDETAVCYKYHI